VFPKYSTTSFDGDIVQEVEAVQLTKENAQQITEWCKGLMVIEHDALDDDKTYVGINVPTLMGKRRASEGNYIIQHSSGEFYVHGIDTFEALYNPIS
jgi:hypothetical protein